ncbi:MAG: sulfatase-like hydrolase/transferase, partial [Dysgonamonadaceae bacterium]|nr:sulfatase-like hydrolase/transferase [Dysgonamonadaceae bacterium]
WAFILIFYILLYIPVFYFWAENLSLEEKISAWIICIIVGLALCSIDLFLGKKGEKIYLTALFLLSIVPNMIVWGYLYISNLYMNRDMFWVIFTSYAMESKEYVKDFISWEIFAANILFLLAGGFLVIKTRSKHSISIKKYRPLFVFSIAIVLIGITLQYTAQAMPVFDFYKSRFRFWKASRIFEEEKNMRKNLKMEVECLLPDSVNHVFVVILGESTSTCHMSLYGYHRQTTPRIDSVRDELAVYTDVVTPENHTIGAMQKILTFANHDHPEYYMQKPSVIEMFNTAGFETYWITNSAPLTKWGGSYGVIAQESKHFFDLSHLEQDDGIILPTLDKVFSDEVKGNKIIFIHLMGNHHAYNCRYPDDFEHFNYKQNRDLPDLGFRNADMMETIDKYDNSVLYGDFIYSQVLRKVKNLNKSSFLLFFSDHGEEVHDTRNARGHFMMNVYPCQARIPFILWRSEKYQTEMPDIIVDTSRPYSIENVIYSLSTLSALQYSGYDRSASLFSREYAVPEKRLVGNEDYEKDIIPKVDLKNKFNVRTGK